MKMSSSQRPERTFEEASRHIKESLQRHLERMPAEDLLSSDPSDDDDAGGGGADQDEGDEAPDLSEELLQKVFCNYDVVGDGKGGLLQSNGTGNLRTREALKEALRGGLASSCLICISSLRKSDPVWSCQSCFCTFHLTCIQRWANDSIFQLKNDLENDPRPGGPRGAAGSPARIQWSCPNCRTAYGEKGVPTRYTCYCGKAVDPPFDPWSVPHSCGETCGRDLDPQCGHRCLVLCHPGPCPPCPKVVKQDCHCRNSAPATRRCFEKEWSCSKPCGRPLGCGQHPCPSPCHPGPCDPCGKTSVQLCRCHRHQKECACAEPTWSCGEKCGRPLGCGHHVCGEECHPPGVCPPCPLSQVRRCPCGKVSYDGLACTVATPTCGGTCGKTLACGRHDCIERCHRGQCSSCLQLAVKSCRCGAKSKEAPCSAADFLCDTKCKGLRDCRNHACRRKCCDGDCPPCGQKCNKQLACKNHRCESRCHPSKCYPCIQTKEVACRCGASRFLVPCGMERTAKPPKCRVKCQEAPDCHHPSRAPHNCHFGPCRPCRQTCGLVMKCGHGCAAPCHDNVTVKKADNGAKQQKPATPWEVTQPKIEVVSVDCPDCKAPVPVTCSGGHETSDWPCFAAKQGPCGRACGRLLACTNHKCERNCHKVKNAPNEMDAGSNCRKCERGCDRARPEGCHHPCPKPCHPGSCDPCSQTIRTPCHCGINQLYVRCGDWTGASDAAALQELGCCQDQCPKLLDCGHRCFMTCHPGKCGDSKECKKKAKVYCPCKRLKQDVACKNRSSSAGLQCNEECKLLREKVKIGEALEMEKRRELEDRQQRAEAEKFERTLDSNDQRRGKRRNRQHHHSDSSSEQLSFFARHQKSLILLLLVAPIGILSSFVWHYYSFET